MSKNMTRKGLAVGSVVALAIAGLSTAPANAAGADGTAQLIPTTGFAEGWAVPASTTATFSATYTTTDTSGGTIKFRVEDPTGKIEPTAGSAGRTALTVDQTSTGDASYQTNTADDLVTILQDGSALAEGDRITFSQQIKDDTLILQAADTLVTVTAVNGTTSFTFKTSADITGSNVTGTSTKLDGTDSVVKVVREARAADNSYVIDTGRTTSTTAAHRTQTIVFSNVDGSTAGRSATVTGWVDNSALLNDRIDSIESTTDAETISFVRLTDVTASTVLTTPVVGDQTLVATITTNPVLNGAQANAQNSGNDLVRAVFTRQDSSANVVSAAATQSLVTGSWSASVSMDSASTSLSTYTNATTALTGSQSWGFTRASAQTVNTYTISSTKVVTFVTAAAHNLRVGDKVTVTSTDVAALAETAVTVTAVPSTTSFTYSLTETGTVTAVTTATAPASSSSTAYTVQTYTSNNSLVDRVFAGAHSAQALFNTSDVSGSERYTLFGTASSAGVLASAAGDVSISTVGTANVQGAVTTADNNTTDALVKSGTTAVTVTATVLDVDGDALGAGRGVSYTIERSSTTTRVNNLTVSGVATTNASGQVAFAVTDTLGLAGTTVTINVTAENGPVSDFTLEWATQAYALYDLNVSSSAALGGSATRLINAGGTYNLNLMLADQWVQPAPAGDWRIALSGSGVTEGFVNLVDGKATVAVRDAGVATSFQSVLTVQRKGTTGVFANTTTATTLTTNTTTAARITLAADASSLFNSVTADLSDAVAKVALVERDTRVAFVAQPAYVNDVVVSGKLTNSTTGANLGNAAVTISGPTSILFSDGAVDKRGSITVVANSSGEFSVRLFSTTAQTDSVITVNAAGATAATTRVTFTGIGVGEGTKLDVTTPANVRPASTFQVKAKLSDTFGNGVDTAAGRVKVTYTGPGIVFGTLPDQTDANGELMFSVLLGSNDTGNVVVTVSYDQNGDADYVDAKDLNTTKTITVGTGAAAGTGKVNVGSFNGKLVVYASGLNGKRISWKVGGNWGSAVASSNYAVFNRPTPRAGATVNVEVFVDGVSTLKKSVVTR